MKTRHITTLFSAIALTMAIGSAAQAGGHNIGEHYLCYDIDPHGGFDARGVKLKDQFTGYEGKVVRPVTLCNPVDKNGEGIINPEIHLVCYEIRAKPVTDGPPTVDVLTSNQFAKQSMTAIIPPRILCVPSKKEHL